MSDEKLNIPEDIEKALESLKSANPNSASEFDILIRSLMLKMGQMQSERGDLSSQLFLQRPSGYVD